MPVYLALFRGINVSGKNIIKMESLRKQMEAAGFDNVRTYIQSGNVIFESKMRSKPAIAGLIEKLVKDEYGYAITVFVLDKNDILKAANNNPFADSRTPEPAGTKKIYVTFLSDVPTEERLNLLNQAPIGDDEITLHDNVLYFKLSVSAADSKLSNNLIESKLKLKATTRNWNTTLKLLEMIDE